MAHSFVFNSIDMATYNLAVASSSIPMAQQSSHIQLDNRAYAFDSKKPPLSIEISIRIWAETEALLMANISGVRKALNQTTDRILTFDYITDRYWMARFVSMSGNRVAPLLWEGSVSFICYDCCAYGLSVVTVGPTNIDADPKIIPVLVGGTALVTPSYSLTGTVVTPATITIENLDTGEALIWGPTAIGPAQVLVIDVEHWLVTLDGVTSMAISGQFPRLLGGQNNNIQITGFGVAGNITVVYRDRYA